MFAPSLKEILAIGLPLLALAGATKGEPVEVQFFAAMWGGLIGALTWFVILRAEYINPFKFTVIFILLPGFLLGGSYFAYRKPAELKPISPQLECIEKGEIEKGSEEYEDLVEKKDNLLIGLAKDCGWIWLVGSAMAAFVLGPLYGRCVKRFDYAVQDTKRSRAMLGRKPTEIHPKDLPPKVEGVCSDRASILSDLPPEHRIRDLSGKEPLCKDTDDDDKSWWT